MINTYPACIPERFRPTSPGGKGIYLDELAESLSWATLPILVCRILRETDPQYDRRNLIIEIAAPRIGLEPSDILDIIGEIESFTSTETDGNAGQEELEPFIEELNSKHAVIDLSGKFFILNEVTNPETGRPDISFSSVNDFKNFYCNQHVRIPHPHDPARLIEVPMGKAWIESINRRQYHGIVFSPSREIPGFFNLWRGFAIQPRKGDWSRIRNHILHVICRGNEQLFNWFMDWLADIVQNPGGGRPGTAIVMRGFQGTGKGIVMSYFGPILGSHYQHLIKAEQLIGRFNAHLKECLLAFLDEALWTGDKAAQGALKGLITEDTIPIELKGKDIIHTKNLIRVVIASNNEWVIPADLEERRFAVFDVSPDKIRDRAYFKSIVDEMENGGREAMLYDLLERDTSGTDLRTIPRTEGLLDQMVNSMNGFQKFWFEILQSGDWSDLLLGINGWADPGMPVSAKKFYNAYVEYSRKMNERKPLTNSQMGLELHKLCPGIKKWRGKAEEKVEGKKRPVSYLFPSLAECRKAFEKKVGIEIKWDEEDL